MKTHISLHTTDLERRVAFYTTLLDVSPMKRYDDYALFITEKPGLELALNYGIAVSSSDAVDAAIARLQAAGLPTDIEVAVLEEVAENEGSSCCST